jgi:hypothetical protein
LKTMDKYFGISEHMDFWCQTDILKLYFQLCS